MDDLLVANSELGWKVCKLIVNDILEELRIHGGSTIGTGGIGVGSVACFL